MKDVSKGQATGQTTTTGGQVTTPNTAYSRGSLSEADFSAPFYDCASSVRLPETVDAITLKVSGGTVKSRIVELDTTRRLLCTHEAWERED